jgi:hypothetical protein
MKMIVLWVVMLCSMVDACTDISEVFAVSIMRGPYFFKTRFSSIILSVIRSSN